MQTSYSVDRAGTAEQEAEAAEEAPKRVRRTREQIEEDKIRLAQARIDGIREAARDRRAATCKELIGKAFRALEPGDVPRPIEEALIECSSLLTGHLEGKQ